MKEWDIRRGDDYTKCVEEVSVRLTSSELTIKVVIATVATIIRESYYAEQLLAAQQSIVDGV